MFFRQIKSLAKRSFVYSLNHIGAKVVGLLITPILTDTSLLSEIEYGIIALGESALIILTALMSFGIHHGFFRFYWDKSYKEKRRELLGNCTIIVIGLAAIIITASFLWPEAIGKALFSDRKYAYIVPLIALRAFFDMWNYQILLLFRLREQAGRFTRYSLFRLFASCGLIIYFLIILRRGLAGFFEAQLIASALSGMLLLPTFRKNSCLKIDWTIIRETISYSFPMMLASLSGLFLIITDRYTLRFMAGLPDVGYYSLGFRIANTVRLFVSMSILSALTPMIMKQMNTPEGKAFMKKSLTYLYLLMSWLSLSFSLVSKEIVSFFTADTVYLVAVAVVPIILLSHIFEVIKNTMTIALNITKKTRLIGLLTVGTSILNVVLNVWLIPIYGFMGAAYATLLMQFFSCIVIYKLSQRYYPVPYSLYKITIPIIVAISIYFLFQTMTHWTGPALIVSKVSLCLLFPIVMYLLRIFNYGELMAFFQGIRDVKKRLI